MRKLAGYTVVAVIGLIAFKFIMAAVGLVFSLLSALATFAAIVFVGYLVLRLVNPAAADRLRETVMGGAGASREDTSESDAT